MKRNLAGRFIVCVVSIVLLLEQTGIVVAQPYINSAFDQAAHTEAIPGERQDATTATFSSSPSNGEEVSSGDLDLPTERTGTTGSAPRISTSSNRLAQHDADQVVLSLKTFPEFIPTAGSVKLE
jgi:hypothetical protein